MESLSPSDHADDRSDDIPEAYKNEATDKMRASQQFSSGNNFTQQLSIEEPEQVGDSTSDDTNSEHEQPNAVVDEEDEDKLIGKSKNSPNTTNRFVMFFALIPLSIFSRIVQAPNVIDAQLPEGDHTQIPLRSPGGSQWPRDCAPIPMHP